MSLQNLYPPVRRVFRTWCQFAQYKRQTAPVPGQEAPYPHHDAFGARLLRAYAAISCILARRAKFFSARQGRRCRCLLQFWRVYSVSRLRLAQRVARFIDMGEATHVKTCRLMRSVLEYICPCPCACWSKTWSSTCIPSDGFKHGIFLEWVHFMQHNQTVVRFSRRCGIAKAFVAWAAISKEKYVGLKGHALDATM